MLATLPRCVHEACGSLLHAFGQKLIVFAALFNALTTSLTIPGEHRRYGRVYQYTAMLRPQANYMPGNCHAILSFN